MHSSSRPCARPITVDCVVEEAFRVFTTDAISWWPLDSHSIHGDSEGDRVRGARGRRDLRAHGAGQHDHWASVLELEPPNRLVLAWNILSERATSTEVEVRFTPEGDTTRVDLEHRGWEHVERERRDQARQLRHGLGPRARLLRSQHLVDQLAQRTEPAQPLVPGHRGIRGRGRREHEERGLTEVRLLKPVLDAPAETRRCTRPSRRTPMTRGRRERAISSSRSAAPAKSALRRSPEPFVVRRAAFVKPIP